MKSNSPTPRPVDDTVQVPAAVRAAAARSAELHKEAYKTQDHPPADGSDPNGGTNGATGGEAPPAPAASGQSETPPAPANTTNPPAQSDPPPADDEQSLQHRYNSLKGRYERNMEDMRRLSDTVTNLQRVIATMNAAPPTPPAGTNGSTPPEQRPTSLLTPEEVETYGSEFLGVVGKKAQEQFEAYAAPLREEIKKLNAQLGNVQGHIAGDANTRMQQTLTSEVSNWKQINENPDFLAWLRLPDTFSGAIRHNLLMRAWEQNDTPRVLAFFKGFLAEEAATHPAGVKPDTGAPAPKVPLDTFAAPGRAKSAATNVPAEKPIITRAQITAFYQLCATNHYKGREKERADLEAQIFEAQAEGRIR